MPETITWDRRASFFIGRLIAFAVFFSPLWLFIYWIAIYFNITGREIIFAVIAYKVGREMQRQGKDLKL